MNDQVTRKNNSTLKTLIIDIVTYQYLLTKTKTKSLISQFKN